MLSVERERERERESGNEDGFELEIFAAIKA
jgi:hypothetical protein